MCKDKNRDDVYYWNCESRQSLDCEGRATTWLFNNEQYFRKTTKHNDAPNASRAPVSNAHETLKQMD